MQINPVSVKPIIVVTRPDVFYDSTAHMFQVEGFKTICEPMLHIHAVAYEKPDTQRYDAYIITSTTSFLFFEFQDRDFSKPVYCVGDVTADKARDIGFKNVIVSSDGTASGLGGILDSTQRYLHVCGEHVHYVFDECFCDRLVVYTVQKNEQFSSGFVDFIKSNQNVVISFYSIRTAEAFIACVRAHGDDSFLNHCLALCIHQNVLNCVRVLPWGNLYVSNYPGGSSMVACLKGM